MKEEVYFLSGRERLFKQLFCMIDWWRYVDSQSLATSHGCGHENTRPRFDKEGLLPLFHHIRVRSHRFCRCLFDSIGLPHFMSVPGCELQDITFLVLFWPVPPRTALLFHFQQTTALPPTTISITHLEPQLQLLLKRLLGAALGVHVNTPGFVDR